MGNFTHLTSENVLVKVDFNKIPDILSMLKRDWPHSIHTYFFLLNFINWTEQNWSGEFDVYRPNADADTDGVMAVAKFKDGYTFVNYHCVGDNSCQNMHNGIKNTKVLNWNKLLIFEAIHEKLVPGLEEIIQAKGLKVLKNDKCHQVWMTPAAAKAVQVDLPDELREEPLTEAQTDLINRNWVYTGPGTRAIVRDSLVLNGGIGLQLRNNDTLVGWSVQQHYGGLGMLFVQPQFRRRGYAAILVKLMVRKAVDKGIDAFAIIEENNRHSSQLFRKLSFEHICRVHWIGVQK